MSENLRQSLSALVDGEADELELRRLLGELGKGDSGEENEPSYELRGTWSRYQLAKSVMRNEHSADFSHIDLSQGIAAAIENESFTADEQTPAKASLPVWLKPISAIAVAASVAMVTVFGVNQYEAIAPGQIAAPAAIVASAVSDPSTAVASPSASPSMVAARAVSPQRLSLLRGDVYAMPANYTGNYSSQKTVNADSNQRARRSQLIARQKLDAYLLHHAEHAALNNSQGMMPLARVARFE